MLLATFAGCRGAAYRDVYSQKMAAEIRNLENQLYDADYQNQVLQDQLTRAEARASQIVVPNQRPPRRFLGRELDADGNVIDMRPQNPEFADPNLRFAPTPPDRAPATPKLPARPLDGMEPLQPPREPPQPPREVLEPPREPVPPGKSDLTIPDVELGDPVPPSTNAPDSPLEFDPAKITIPGDARLLSPRAQPEPVSIRVNPGLSGGHQTDDSKTPAGVELLIEAIDESGKVVNLAGFDVDATMTVVLLDPTKAPDAARIGKWDFGPEEIRDMIQTDTVSPQYAGNLHVIIPWQSVRPETGAVIAHIRLAADGAVLKTQAEINTKQPAVAQWTPRASIRR